MTKTDTRTKITEHRQKTQNSFLLYICTLCSAFFVLFPEAAFASEGGGEGGFNWGALIPPVVNFGIVVLVIFYFGRKPISDFFRNRTEMIEKSLKDAQEAKVLAQQTLDQVKERLKNTDQEINAILEASKKSGEKEKESIIAEGERISAKILEQAQSNIAFELQKARESIKSEAALLALELAEKQIKSKLGAKEQETLIDEYIKKLEVKN